ncbi:MAG: hypothetical protein AABY22_09085 [Nanoarchaeota archaeon]
MFEKCINCGRYIFWQKIGLSYSQFSKQGCCGTIFGYAHKKCQKSKTKHLNRDI